MDDMGWIELEDNGVVSKDPIIVYGIACTMNNDGDQIKLYEGQDANSGRLIHPFKGFADESRTHLFPGGIPCERGAYVAMDSGCKATVYYKGLPSHHELYGEE